MDGSFAVSMGLEMGGGYLMHSQAGALLSGSGFNVATAEGVAAKLARWGGGWGGASSVARNSFRGRVGKAAYAAAGRSFAEIEEKRILSEVWSLAPKSYNVYRGVGAGRFASAGAAADDFLSSTAHRAAILSRAGRILSAVGRATWVVPLAMDIGEMVAGGLSALGQDYSRPEYGGTFIDTEQAYTQRQAGIAAIHNSQLATRSMFAREAAAFHQ